MNELEQKITDGINQYNHTVSELSELEQKFEDIQRQAEIIEKTISDLKIKTENLLDSGIESIIIGELNYTANLLEERNQSYQNHNTDNFSDESIEDDKRIIDLYKKNEDFEKVRSVLQEPYQEALRREEERKQLSECSQQEIEADIVIYHKEENLVEIYLPVKYDSQDDGLMGSLTEVLANTLTLENVSEFKDENADGLLKIVLNENYDGLAETLADQKPENFTEAKINYNVLVIPQINNPSSQDITDFLSQDKSEVASIKYEHFLDQILIKHDGKEYIRANKVSKSLGVNPSSLYGFLDLNGRGETVTIVLDNKRYIEKSSLIDLVNEKYEGTSVYTIDNAAKYCNEEIQKQINNTKTVEHHHNILEQQIENKSIICFKKDDETYFSSKVLDEFILYQIAEETFSNPKQEYVTSELVLETLGINKNRLNHLISEDKLKLEDERITINSAKEFLNTHYKSGNRWYEK